MVFPSVARERIIGPGTGPYLEGEIKDEVKAHLTPAGYPCPTRRGVVTKAEQYTFYDQRAEIECECGTVVTESS
jgi:hypothetical protein